MEFDDLQSHEKAGVAIQLAVVLLVANDVVDEATIDQVSKFGLPSFDDGIICLFRAVFRDSESLSRINKGDDG